MIDVGQLKKYDYVEIGGKIGQVRNIDYYREVDDEHEEITVGWGDVTSSNYIVPNFAIERVEPLTLKVGDRVRCINDWIFVSSVKVGTEGTITKIQTNGEVGIDFDGCDCWQITNRPTLYLKKVNLGEEKMIKVGDIVTVKCGEDTKNKYHINPSMETMERENKGYEVTDIRDGGILVEVKDGYDTWNFHINDVKLFNKGEEKMNIEIDIEKIIFNNPATILYANGERYVSKAYQEEFDKEKGLLMCLIKAFGISHLDLQRLIKSATVQENKAPKKKVEIKVDKSTPKTEKPKKKCVGRVEQTVEVEKDGSKYTIHKGKRRGVGQKLQFGDSVLVRLCKFYDYEEIETVRELIGRPLKVSYVGESTVMLTLDGNKSYEFARNEVDRI